MTARLLLDEMYPATLAKALCDKGNDVESVVAGPLAGRDDATVLDAATAAGRCVVTENVRDFAVLSRQVGHAGILFVNARRWPRTPNGLPKLTEALHDLITAGGVPGANDTAWLT